MGVFGISDTFKFKNLHLIKRNLVSDFFFEICKQQSHLMTGIEKQHHTEKYICSTYADFDIYHSEQEIHRRKNVIANNHVKIKFTNS